MRDTFIFLIASIGFLLCGPYSFQGIVYSELTDEAIESYAREVKKEADQKNVKVYSEAEKEFLIETALKVLEIGANYTPENYAERYDDVSKMATPQMQLTYKEYRQSHLDEVLNSGHHLQFVPDRNSIRIVDKTKPGDTHEYLHVVIQGDQISRTQAEPKPRRTKVEYVVMLEIDPTEIIGRQIKHNSWTIEEK